jgi:hypothetical protein
VRAEPGDASHDGRCYEPKEPEVFGNRPPSSLAAWNRLPLIEAGLREDLDPTGEHNPMLLRVSTVDVLVVAPGEDWGPSEVGLQSV